MHTPLCLSTSSPRPLPFGQHTHTHTPPTHLPQIKDRHNGNILIDDQGCLVHIDFGFMLSNSPGGLNFEAAPFKLTREMLEVMDSNSDGKPSEMFDYFKVRLFVYACVGTVVMCMWCLCVCVCLWCVWCVWYVCACSCKQALLRGSPIWPALSASARTIPVQAH